MLQAYYKVHILNFKQPSGTSRGVYTNKPSWFIFVFDTNIPQKIGVGESSLLKGLSIDDRPDYLEKLTETCENINNSNDYFEKSLKEFPSIAFGLETALLDLKAGADKLLFTSDFTKNNQPIKINGLIWMGDIDFMLQQIHEKITNNFKCIKIKIGAKEFQEELKLIQEIRRNFSAKDVEIRLDANGGYEPSEVNKKLEKLATNNIHSIEQPIKTKQWEKMADICKNSPIPIAMDEELIGITTIDEKIKLVETIKPHYLILKPSLIGGIKKTDEWIKVAQENKIGWWITSALESNIGLNAIAQWTYTLKNNMAQGLGTGQLFTNNILSPLYLKEDSLYHSNKQKWGNI